MSLVVKWDTIHGEWQRNCRPPLKDRRSQSLVWILTTQFPLSLKRLSSPKTAIANTIASGTMNLAMAFELLACSSEEDIKANNFFVLWFLYWVSLSSSLYFSWSNPHVFCLPFGFYVRLRWLHSASSHAGHGPRTRWLCPRPWSRQCSSPEERTIKSIK